MAKDLQGRRHDFDEMGQGNPAVSSRSPWACNTCGHGHADALSVLFSWDNVPVLIDLGSGQYNGDQTIRVFFRSTIAHNTIEIGGKNQAKILGPFMWKKSYKTNLVGSGVTPNLFAEANHDGYKDEYSVTHTRKVDWSAPDLVEIHDSFRGPGGVPMRGAFHLGPCRNIVEEKGVIKADFGDFMFSIALPDRFSIRLFYGSEDPFMGWRSTIYGEWVPIYSIIFSDELESGDHYRISFKLAEKE